MKKRNAFTPKESDITTLQRAWAHHQAGRLAEAEQGYREILAREPDHPDALNLFGALAHQVGNYEVAMGLIGRAIESNPGNAQYYNNLGVVFKDLKQYEEALECFDEALSLQPDLVNALNNKGIILKQQGRQDEAVECYRAALALNANHAHSWVNLGNIFQERCQFDDAVDCYERAIETAPNMPDAYVNLGKMMNDLGKLDDAVECFEKALEVNPDYVPAYANLGIALKDRGEQDQAIDRMRQGFSIKPDDIDAHSALLFSLHFWQHHSGREAFAEYQRWNERHAQPLGGAGVRVDSERDPQRRLRIGYVSSDFRNHATAYFIEPVLTHHEKDRFEVICYDNYLRPDAVTERLKQLPAGWRHIAGLSDEAVADLVRQDRIDILVDLKGHTDHNRLLVFARKPAPVQVTWLGYPNTTGLTAMDYWLVDPHVANPAGMIDQCASETLVPLPDFYMCFQPSADSPPVSPLPALTNGYLTLGSFNAFSKITPAVIDLWATILAEIPNSRLIMLTVPEGEAQRRVYERFAERGIARERVEIVMRVTHLDFLRLHQVVDVALDPFPCVGTTTTLHGIWMGVPIVTLEGTNFAARVGVSILRNLGLDELIAQSPDQYLEIVRALSQDLGKLAQLRAGMRERMAASPLVDAPRFTRNLERAYREMWGTWCAQPD